ncbi:NAD(P)(+) transhydrogenase (Re/Si-specific) subunit beta [Streptomyces acidiscabies]|uniref:NAD(P) transhydrogenase subunit beta n=1 Tax=Streptomyces acidiscabies TaxID=42234 RepID=A0AAP6EGY1_9ACTN|nr:NAD(P)(+) transhydrogenase (Re/Si-specific) subunit beta [Streptomyces acidiscabies]MBP5942436.1 NAD(P)(+) transhydrogenase (Re/Si-specific) subunit beta [Streptomyces sp. LBUM 1476]MBZ3917820.1 NAD(P)(+) transhydrogenase (Re/Si-specific) subunit beta [Streptomyces acidiscabies]MDX2961790.1 NAD(P)(+) transhydrogenase (Re/Si-specific) subunit beta [Streptomyces acidiscabies]MDX3023463.1 NAD(P)(+) transhydrogenase (Re/Si-specific) subunit beta [Streptomyces acidiscabies]MDX3789331.1 NAD(P)(+)
MVSDTVHYVFLAAAACFVLGLHLMNHPRTARRGNTLSAAAMSAAIAATVWLVAADGTVTRTGWLVLACGGLLGAALGLWAAREVKMTAMPQLVSVFNAVGGGAAALIAVTDLLQTPDPAGIGARVSLPGALDIVIGAVTFSGSLIAAGKLQGIVSGAPVVFPGARLLNVLLPASFTAGTVWLVLDPGSRPALYGLAALALLFGVTMVLPIGGADMPVVIALLNAFTGSAVAMAGFVLDETALIVAGMLVSASGGILTKLMADAMNRSVANIVVGGFGTGDNAPATTGAPPAQVRSLSADDVAIQLAYARKVILVPGYGLAAAQAQHELGALAQLLTDHGVDVSYAVHPVAGRMPGHMNVLLAEANVPYTQLKEMDDVNPEFPQADVALVIGANDVTNPLARRPGNAISGMPILDVDKARSVVVIKRSMGHGYAGIDNELYTEPRTGMFFTDAKKGLTELKAAVGEYVA